MVLRFCPYQDSAAPAAVKLSPRINGANSMYLRVAFFGVLAWAIAALPAVAAVVGDASVPYSATRIVTVNGKTYEGRVFHTPGKQRHDVDINGLPMIFILDIADSDGVVVLPDLKSYIDFPLPPLLAELDRRQLGSDAVGEERINGMRATKYRINYTASDGSRGEGLIWLSRDNILLRLEGRIVRPHHHKPMTVSMSLSDLRVGPQDKSLFLIHKGLHKIPYEALELLMNMRAPKSRGK
jgi:hypothetical protein